jgi:hypothetical protein
MASYTGVMGARRQLTVRKYATLYLMCFTALVTVLFKVPRLFSDRALSARLIPLLSNLTTFGALLAIYEDVA